MNTIKRVNEHLYDIKRKEKNITEIKQQISMCTDEKRKKDLKNSLKNEKKSISSFSVDVARLFMDNMNESELEDLWEDSNSRTEIFKQLRVYFGKGYDHKIDAWGNIFEFYVFFLEVEIDAMLNSRQSFDLTQKMQPKAVLNREKINDLFAYLKEAQENISNYKYEGTENFNNRIEQYKKSFIDLKTKLQELYAYLLYEETKYNDALSLYERLAKEHSKTDSYWHSSTFWRKGDIYCAKKRYDLALKEYDLAASVMDGRDEKDQIKEIKIRRSKIAAILGQ